MIIVWVLKELKGIGIRVLSVVEFVDLRRLCKDEDAGIELNFGDFVDSVAFLSLTFLD